MEVYVAGKGIERPLRVGIALDASQDRGASETNKQKKQVLDNSKSMISFM